MIDAKQKDVSQDSFHPLRRYLREVKNEIWNEEEKWQNERSPCTEEQRNKINEYLKYKQAKEDEEAASLKEQKNKILKEEEERAEERKRRARRTQCDPKEIKLVEVGKMKNKSDWRIMGVQMKEIILVRKDFQDKRKIVLQASKEVQLNEEGKIITVSEFSTEEEQTLLGVSIRNVDSLQQEDYECDFTVFKSLPTGDYSYVGEINMKNYIEDLCNMYIPNQLPWDIIHGDEFLF
jgi:hypothetical protein